MCEHPTNEEVFAIAPIVDSEEVLAVVRDDIYLHCSCSDCLECRREHRSMFYYTYIFHKEVAEQFSVARVQRLPTVNRETAEKYEDRAMWGFREWLKVKKELLKA